MFFENNNVVYIDYKNLLDNYLDLKCGYLKEVKKEDFFVLNFAAMFIVPKFKLKELLKVGIINRDALSALFKTSKNIIKHSVEDFKSYGA